MRRITLFLSGLMTICISFAQPIEEIMVTETDTIFSGPVIFTTSSASEYIIKLIGMDSLWRPAGDTIRLSLGRLVDHFNEPFDSVESRLNMFHYDSISFKHTDIVRKDSLPIKWLNKSTFIIDTLALERDPRIMQKTITKKESVISSYALNDTIPEMEVVIDTVLEIQDTITEIFIDSVFLRTNNIQMYQVADKQIIPSPIIMDSRKSAEFSPDSARLIISDTVQVIVANKTAPFYIVPNEQLSDSLRYAVQTLLAYTQERDSILLYINDINGHSMPFWLTSGKEDLYRYWVKNQKNDSITIWLGNPSRNDISLLLEEDVNVTRMEKKTVDDIPITTLRPLRTLTKVAPLKIIPVFWKYGFTSGFTLNQTHLSNWSKGGESSLATTIDIRGTADYTNNEINTQWNNNARFRYGSIITEQHGLRKTTDMLEFNSQYNKRLLDKIDFSTVFYMKNQIAKGYKYPNDSVVVSKFLNPGTFTIGAGVEYKPDKNTRFNLSILSYKNTFVLDTASINQKAHGIDLDKRAKQEMGGQLVVRNSMNILDDLKISNTVRLFTNYFNNPEKIDVDWEVDLSKRINWYFTIRLNLHMIFDDDVLFPVLDKNKEPVLLPDGSKKMKPKIQFKEMLGLTLSFRI